MSTGNLIIYHGNCTDGFAAATTAWLALGDIDTEYMAAFYGVENRAPDVFGKTVYLLDFVYPFEEMRRLASQAEKLVIIDHHKTAAPIIHGLIDECFALGSSRLEVVFSVEHSGSWLAWEYFNPDKAHPELFIYIDDFDCKKMAMQTTEDVVAAAYSYPWDFMTWANLFERKVDELRNEGRAINRHSRKHAQSTKGTAHMVELKGHRVPAVNVPAFACFETAEALMDGEVPFVVCYWDASDHRVYSLRGNGVIDVEAIAKEYGGGGHAHTAQFRLCFEDAKKLIF